MPSGISFNRGERISQIDCSSKDIISTHPWWLVGDGTPISYEEYVSNYTQSKDKYHFLRPHKQRSD